MYPCIDLWENYKLDERSLDEGLYVINTKSGLVEYEVKSERNKYQLDVVKMIGSGAKYEAGYIEKYKLSGYMALEKQFREESFPELYV
ncbi:hypothetical protein R8N45_08550 [Vibrio sp. 1403]|uniref:hypothetical protein n=1 Tax=Vibrio TaxID=662 RepID=UPI001A906A04|nr:MULTISPECIES: hypothetical protein [Vibrio]MBO0197735.1 hypothetical protein [Vibrio alginolyticus]MDW3078572.1 hypothetical protein [Vibrio sp. 1403]